MTWRLLRQRDPTTTMMALVLVLETEIRMLLGYVFVVIALRPRCCSRSHCCLTSQVSDDEPEPPARKTKPSKGKGKGKGKWGKGKGQWAPAWNPFFLRAHHCRTPTHTHSPTPPCVKKWTPAWAP